MKETIKFTLYGIAIFLAVVAGIYLLLGLAFWIFNDLLNFIEDSVKCDYVIPAESLSCKTKAQYCRYETKKMFNDLNDTWGSNTNNADTMSKTMLEVYNKCLEKE